VGQDVHRRALRVAEFKARKAGSKQYVYIEIKIDDVIVTSVSTGGSGGDDRTEPPRICRRPFGLSHAAMAGSSSMA
jgi:type VI protein secretion system component Hcp